ncbi:ABC transporter ATP-binding protein [Streptomyces sp. NPDC048507]|uniref:ABC transporter ATP-binding protein n=1 Tax=Streptomyces sp. NPDC048507 TaxID=3365560 RepID=UPI003718C50C
MRSAAISVRGLRKAYGDHVVLDGVDFAVATGSVFSLLGAAGAGKTTTHEVLTTLRRPDAGTVRIAGHDVATATGRVRAAIGVSGRTAAVDGLLTGRENLRLMADLRRVPRAGHRVARLLERFDLVDAADERASAYAPGARRRLDLAMTLVGDPQVLFLDEPTSGLDPPGRRTVWGIVRELVFEGTTVFLTTRHLEEADQLADQIAVLHRGRLTARGTPEELRRRIPAAHVRLRFADPYDLDAAARVLTGAARDDAELTLRVPGDGETRTLRDLLDRLALHSVDALEFSVHRPGPDEVLRALTGNPGDAPPGREAALR